MVDRDLRYAEIKHNPESYKGKLMLVGGQVLSAERVQGGAKFVLLQIPLSEDLIPAAHEAESKGRFVVIDRNGQLSDPAIFNAEKRITAVGEVLGTTTVKVDEVQLQVPLLALEHVTVWELGRVRARYWPYCGFGDPYRWGYYGYSCYDLSHENQTRLAVEK
jgi:outer membrane lipoprotein